ncbi:MAG: glycyl-radical enzyme activating protein [Clostridia bacterium]|nr:glycyl-radical enzyme activating protein [Clostridia bacterium]
MKATIFNIQKFCVNDGPGIRTTVFFKGCPLSCLWCHNPESKKVQTEIFFDVKKCIGCGKCVPVCPKAGHNFEENIHIYNRENCIACKNCSEACPAGALESVGYEISVDEIIKEVLKDKTFYDNSNGGMTVSGGEPMLQFDFLYELLKRAKEENLHVCMETCGFAPSENYEKIAPYVDIFLFDYKISNAEDHKKYTGQSNELILKNLKMLDEMGSKTVLRCPIIPTVNDTDEHFEAIGKLAESMKNVIEINVEPYHPLGSGKTEMLGREYELKDITFPKDETVSKWIEKIKKHTKVDVKKA